MDSNCKDQLIGKIYDTALNPGDWIDLLAPITQWSAGLSEDVADPLVAEEMQQLVAHLERASRSSAYLHALEDQHRLLHAVYDNMPWPMLMLDAGMKVMSANTAALNLMSVGAPISLGGDNTLQLRNHTMARELRDVLNLAGGREAQLLSSQAEPLSIFCLPVEKSDGPGEVSRVRAVIWILAAEQRVVPSVESLQAAFGLTPAEGRLLHLLCKVGSIVQCAELLSISIHTARSQMKAIMSKARVSSQIQLVGQAMAHSVFQGVGTLAKHGTYERRMTLPDGRILSWYEYGDPKGRAILSLENLGSSIPDHERFDAWYREQRLRVVVVVRPGYGISTARSDLRFVDLAADLRSLCEHLGLDQPPMAAYCCGGAYALCAAAIDPKLFDRVGVLAGTVPIEHFDLSKLDWMHGMLLRLFQRDPRLFLLIGRMALRGVKRAPEKYFSKLAAAVGGRDRELLEQPDILAAIIRQMRIRHFQGAAVQLEEYLRLQAPWDVDLASIRIPVMLWHGEDDAIISIDSARAMAQTIPTADLTVMPGHGHFLVYDLWPQFLTALLARS